MRRNIMVGTALLATALLAAACSGSTAPTATSGKPVYGGNLVIARTADSQSMDKTTVFDNESIWVFEQIYQTLYTVTPNGKGVMPELATGYTVSPNKLSYTFTLRPKVTFSDGKPLTSEDVKFSIDQATAAAQGWGYINSAIKDITAPSPSTVVINLKYPWAPILADLSLFSNGIIPANYGGQTAAQFYQHPIGTGPFMWDKWVKGQYLKLVKNPHYWVKGKPYLDSVTWTNVPDGNTRELQLKGGQAQIDEFPAWSTVAALRSTPGISMNLFNSTRTDYLLLNENRPQYKDARVRRAISYAINRKALVTAVLFGNGKPANSFMPPQVPYYDPSSPGIQYNLAKAKQEMASSGYPKGFTTTLMIAAGNADNNTVAQILQAELRPLGINVKIQQLDPNLVNTNQQSLKYDMTLSYWTMDIPDPDELVTFAVDPAAGSKSFFTNYNNPTVVNAAHLAERTYDPAARQALYNQIQTLTAHDAFMGFLYYSPYAYATTTSVKGFYVTPLGNYHLENVWLSKS